MRPPISATPAALVVEVNGEEFTLADAIGCLIVFTTGTLPLGSIEGLLVALGDRDWYDRVGFGVIAFILGMIASCALFFTKGMPE